MAPRASHAQLLSAGDRLVYEAIAAFGFESLPAVRRDPCTIETRLALGVASVDASGMDVDVEISIGVRAVRYQGPTFCWTIEPATKDGFIAAPPSAREAADLAQAPLPRSLPPLAVELVRKELLLMTTVASLHGCHAAARVSCGPDPFVRIEHVDAPAFTAAQVMTAERYLRAAILLAFPPIPLDLGRDTERYDAGGSTYAVTGFRDAIWPIRGREHRVKALAVSSAARAAFAFEAINDTGLEPCGAGARAREWADIHAPLGIAGRRHVRIVTDLARRDGRESVSAVASWTTDLVRATGTRTEVARR
jgi:hypothetical protein